MGEEVLLEQMLRQQRNEISLLHATLEMQASELRTIRDRLESVVRERRTLVDFIARDLKSALTILDGYHQWLAARLPLSDLPDVSPALNIMDASIQRMNTLVESVQAIERIEMALTSIRWQMLDLPALVGSVVSMWRAVAELQGARLLFEVPASVATGSWRR